MLAWSEIRFHRLRFALIVVVVALLSALVFLMGAIGVGLGDANVAAVRQLPGDGIALEAGVDRSLPRSVLSRAQVERIAASPAVAWAEPLVSTSQIAEAADGRRFGVSVLGVPADSRALPAGVRLTDGSAVLDTDLDGAGIATGDALVVGPGRRPLDVAATTRGAKLAHQPVAFVTDAAAQRLRADAAGARVGAAGTVSGVMIGLRPGHDLAEVRVDGVEAATREEAAQAMPGYAGEQGTTRLVQFCLYLISGGVLATFFWMITVQKSSSLAVLRASGLSGRALAGSLIGQVVAITAAGLAAGAVAAAAMTAAIPSEFSAVLAVGDVLSASAVLLVLAVLAAGLALRTLLATDPLLALQRA